MMKHLIWVVYLHTYVYGLDMLLHLLLLLLFSCTVLLISFLFLFLMFHIFLLNFAANTIWYLHSHVVCAKLSAYGFFIRLTPLIINILSRQTLNIISCWSEYFCYSVQNYKFFYTPQHSWGFTLNSIKKINHF